MRDTIREALTTTAEGRKVIVASSECMLNRQRREKPLAQKAIREGRRVEAPRFGVDEAVCTGDHACIRLSGCPSLSLKRLDDPLRDDPVASIDQSCVGCGNCGEVADAAVLCPSSTGRTWCTTRRPGGEVGGVPGPRDRLAPAAARARRLASGAGVTLQPPSPQAPDRGWAGHQARRAGRGRAGGRAC
jgi:NAD-dependent dihydropyrimidine dehydrogenase PreA subunit